jgi:hypothetical protein
MDETAENFISIDDYIHLFCSEFFSYPKGVVFCLAMPINWNTLQNCDFLYGEVIPLQHSLNELVECVSLPIHE